MNRVDKIIFHYTNGKSYTLTNTYIDCYIDWDNMRVALLNSNSFDGYEKSNMVTIPEDCVAITAVGDDRVTCIWENPRYKTSVKISVMTANTRCKKNRKSKNQTPPPNDLQKTIEEIVDESFCEVIRKLGLDS